MSNATARQRSTDAAIARVDAYRLKRVSEMLMDLDGDEATTPRPPAQAIDWSSKIGLDPPARQWAIESWLPWASTLLSGRGGIGKSLVAQTIGTSLAIGRDYLGKVGRQATVLIWACEDDADEIWRRQVAICAHFGISIGDLQDRLIIQPREGMDNTLLDLAYGRPVATHRMDELREQVNDHGVDVLILDNLGQVFGGNESDRHQATLFVNAIKGLVRGRDFAPVFMGHVARAEGSEYSGSAAWENACRSRWYLGRTLPGSEEAEDDQDTDVVYLARRKANYSAKDHIRLRYTAGVFIPDQAVSLGYADRDKIAEQVVLKGFDKLTSMGIKPTDGSSSPDYLPKKLLEMKLGQGSSKKELAGAMHRLMSAGTFTRGVVGTYANRSVKQGLIRS